MIDEIVLRQGLTLRELEPSDEPEVLRLMAASEDYFVTASGLPAAPADVQSLYYSLPEGAHWEDKLLLVAVRDERVVAVVDAVAHYPGQGDCAIGLFLVDPDERRRGTGAAIAEALLARASDAGIATITATTPPGWQPGEEFLRAHGFTLGEPPDAAATPPTIGNRSAGPREPPVRRAILHLTHPA